MLLNLNMWRRINLFKSSSNSEYMPSKIEIIGFRSMLLFWGVGFIFLISSGFSYYMYWSHWNSIKELANKSIQCESRLISGIPACNSTYNGAYEDCRSSINAKCDDHRSELFQQDAREWDERKEWTLCIAFFLFVSLHLPSTALDGWWLVDFIHFGFYKNRNLLEGWFPKICIRVGYKHACLSLDPDLLMRVIY